ncbi:MAG: hypothetical protein KJ923_04285 [Candidatus Omnitrophica bacterium]|nr:hypothetical protein [Candidatus Omnitrophota bacterium]
MLKQIEKNLFLSVVISFMVCIPAFSYAQEAESFEKQLVLQEARESRKGAVAVEVYLKEDILEVTIIGRMYAAKPKIYNALIVGPKLGRLSPGERETLYPKAEDEEAFYKTTELEGGLIRFSKKTKEKKLKGTLTKEFCRFKIPTEKIMPNKRYQLWIQLQDMQRSDQPVKFKFDLEELPGLILEK